MKGGSLQDPTVSNTPCGPQGQKFLLLENHAFKLCIKALYTDFFKQGLVWHSHSYKGLIQNFNKLVTAFWNKVVSSDLIQRRLHQSPAFLSGNNCCEQLKITTERLRC